jgi:hypothetical protein
VSESQLIVVENQQTVLGWREVFNLVWAVNYQLLFHYGRSEWVTEGYAPHAHAMLLPQGVKPPAGAWSLILLDTTDQAGALGYHDDEQGTEIPYSDVFCQTAIADGATPSSVASHEALEMIVDPYVASPRVETNPADGRQYIVEVGDPVQGCDYDIGAPEGRMTGTMVADFALPVWWGMKSSSPTQMSFRGSVSQPFQIAPAGYISWCAGGADPADPSTTWSQTFGQEKTALPAWASRLPRIHPTKEQ